MTLDDHLPRRTITLHFGDEIRAIKQGVRKVVIWSIGPTTVTLRKPGSTRDIVIPRYKWDHILACKKNAHAMDLPDASTD